MSEHHRGGGLVWPVILIGAGVVLLLNNLGVLGWGVWETLFRLWPVLLIAVGLEILIGRRSMVGSLVIALLLLAVLGAAIGFGLPQWSWNQAAGPFSTEVINQPLEGARRAEIEIGFGTGGLEIRALEESAGLVEGKLMLEPGERVSPSFRKSGDTAYFQLRSQGIGMRWVGQPGSNNKTWTLGLNRDIPLRLKVNTGVGRSTLDLSELNLTGFDLNSGVGQTQIVLPRRGRLDARCNAGIGELDILIPAGMAARVTTNGGLGGIRVTGDFVRSGDTYTSPEFNTAEHRVELKINGGIGRVTVRSEGE